MTISTINQKLTTGIWQPNTPKPRKYQLNIFASAKTENLLVVIPTGLGKTYIATLLGVYFLKKFNGTKNLVDGKKGPEARDVEIVEKAPRERR